MIESRRLLRLQVQDSSTRTHQCNDIANLAYKARVHIHTETVPVPNPWPALALPTLVLGLTPDMSKSCKHMWVHGAGASVRHLGQGIS